MSCSDLEGLRNSGLVVLNDNPSDISLGGTRTIVITGVARSGTSMIAQVLSSRGVDLGERHDTVVFEDQVAQEFLLDNDLVGFERYARARDQRSDVWAFKKPHLHLHGADILGLLRNPVLVVTFRDPVAIARRNAISEGISNHQAIGEALQDLQGMLDFALKARCPVLLVSYEKALVRPRLLVEELLRFCGLPDDEASVASLVRNVEPDRETYLRDARRRFEGYVDDVIGGRLRGWARQLGSAQPETVTVFLDQKLIASAVADRHRPDLDAAGIGPHAFELDVAAFSPDPEMVVHVKIAGRVFELENSGRSYRRLLRPDHDGGGP